MASLRQYRALASPNGNGGASIRRDHRGPVRGRRVPDGGTGRGGNFSITARRLGR